MTKPINQSTSPAGGQPPALPQGRRLLRYRDLVKLFPFGRRTIERWVQAGRFPRGRIIPGGQVRVWTVEEILEWQDSALNPESRNVA